MHAQNASLADQGTTLALKPTENIINNHFVKKLNYAWKK